MAKAITTPQHDPHEITVQLLQFAPTIPSADLFPTLVPEAATLATSDPYAFSLAASLDRGMKAEIAWTIPYDMKNFLGHLNPVMIERLPIDEIRALLLQLPRRPRYMHDAPRTIKELTTIVVREYGGDASRIWKGKTAREVKATFLRIHGVGTGIANMAVLLIEKAFGIEFTDLDRQAIDVKPDVHIVRTLLRLGIISSGSSTEAIEAARRLNPAFPGAIDGPLWIVGRRWCHATHPTCHLCILNAVCPRAGAQG